MGVYYNVNRASLAVETSSHIHLPAMGIWCITTVATLLNVDVYTHRVHCAMYQPHGAPDWSQYVTADSKSLQNKLAIQTV